jgi:GNAT superfamily N-acetyltransferase
VCQPEDVLPFETRDPALLRTVFARHPAASLYLWSDLVEPFFSQCRWFVTGEAALLWFGGLSAPSLQTTGEAGDAAVLLDQLHAVLPREAWIKAPPEHEAHFARHFALTRRSELTVMLREAPLPPVPGPVRRLAPGEPLAPLFELYSSYPGHFFEAASLEGNIYYVAEQDGRPVSIAGTHTAAPAEGVAVLGNIVTAPEFRGRGLARRCIAAAARELESLGCRLTGLHVDSTNDAALSCYRGLGFRARAALVQAWAAPAGRDPA